MLSLEVIPFESLDFFSTGDLISLSELLELFPLVFLFGFAGISAIKFVNLESSRNERLVASHARPRPEKKCME